MGWGVTRVQVSGVQARGLVWKASPWLGVGGGAAPATQVVPPTLGPRVFLCHLLLPTDCPSSCRAPGHTFQNAFWKHSLVAGPLAGSAQTWLLMCLSRSAPLLPSSLLWRHREGQPRRLYAHTTPRGRPSALCACGSLHLLWRTNGLPDTLTAHQHCAQLVRNWLLCKEDVGD